MRIKPNRRSLIESAGGVLLLGTVGRYAMGTASSTAWRMGVIADLHYGFAPDAHSRLDQFMESVAEVQPDCVMQLGDFNFGVLLSTLVSLDAFVVLAAALLTGYVGIDGLIRRMSMDRCLPQFFLLKNPWTGTDSFILVGFFFLCVSQVVVLDSNVEALGGVYCYAFLTVMTIFAYGNILLKIKRPSLPREVTTGWVHSGFSESCTLPRER